MEQVPVVIHPDSEEAFASYFDLRWEVLRKPWNRPPGSERDELDAVAVHGMIQADDGRALAVGRVHMTTDRQAQVRYMGVRDTARGRGLGTRMLRYLEKEARKLGAQRIILQAREPAVPFYKRHGYTILEKTYILFDEIQHFLMTKELPEA